MHYIANTEPLIFYLEDYEFRVFFQDHVYFIMISVMVVLCCQLLTHAICTHNSCPVVRWRNSYILWS